MTNNCQRCGIAAQDTPEGFLAFNGGTKVCADCNDDLDREYCARTGAIHPVDTFCPAAHVAARYCGFDPTGENIAPELLA